MAGTGRHQEGAVRGVACQALDLRLLAFIKVGNAALLRFNLFPLVSCYGIKTNQENLTFPPLDRVSIVLSVCSPCSGSCWISVGFFGQGLAGGLHLKVRPMRLKELAWLVSDHMEILTLPTSWRPHGW